MVLVPGLGAAPVAALAAAAAGGCRSGASGPSRPAADRHRTSITPAADRSGAGAARRSATLSLADRLAAEGRYAEAIRQRLRDTLRELIAARLVPPQPGWTAAELATMASTQRPAVAWPLGNATELFSEIWYGDRPAAAHHDERMRDADRPGPGGAVKEPAMAARGPAARWPCWR